VSWVVKDGSGAVVRTGLDNVSMDAGSTVRFFWNGTDDAGQQLPNGTYQARVRVVRPAGSYGHEITVRKMPFWFKPSRWTVRRGDTLTIVVDSAEPLAGRPIISAKAPRRDWVRLRVARVDDDSFRTRFETRRAWSSGTLRVRIEATDADGGTNAKGYTLQLR
jgi:hypothetical protein